MLTVTIIKVLTSPAFKKKKKDWFNSPQTVPQAYLVMNFFVVVLEMMLTPKATDFGGAGKCWFDSQGIA